jgi:hypothetical protein
MHSLDAASAAELETHFGCGVRLFALLTAVDCQFVGEDILEEWKRMYVGEHAFLRHVSRSGEDVRGGIIYAQRCLCRQPRIH